VRKNTNRCAYRCKTVRELPVALPRPRSRDCVTLSDPDDDGEGHKSLLERGQSPITVLGSGGASPARHAPKVPRRERAASTRKSAASARTQKGGSLPMPSIPELTSPARTAATVKNLESSGSVTRGVQERTTCEPPAGDIKKMGYSTLAVPAGVPLLQVSVAFASSGLRLLLPVGIRQGRRDEEWRQGISCRGRRSTPPGGHRFPCLPANAHCGLPECFGITCRCGIREVGSPGRAVGSHPSPLSACAFQRFQTVKERALGEAH